MGQRRASHSPGHGRFPGRRSPRRSLPDVIDSVSMTAATRTTSMGSSLCDIKGDHRGSISMLGSRRVSYDLCGPRRPSAKSLTLPCFCGAAMRPGRACTCGANNGGSCGGGVRSSLVPLLGLSSSDHSSTASGEAAIPLEEREEEEEEAREQKATTSTQKQLEDGEGGVSPRANITNNQQQNGDCKSHSGVTNPTVFNDQEGSQHSLADVAL